MDYINILVSLSYFVSLVRNYYIDYQVTCYKKKETRLHIIGSWRQQIYKFSLNFALVSIAVSICFLHCFQQHFYQPRLYKTLQNSTVK